MENYDSINNLFNERLQQQIDGILPNGFVYELGMPSDFLLSAGVEDLPIEMSARRLNDKSMQENHPFELSEIFNLPNAIQRPLAVFRSATNVGAFVVLTELKHKGRNFVTAIHVNQSKNSVQINSIRSIHYRTLINIVGWIAEGLGEYFCDNFETKWLNETKKELLSKPQYNSEDVRKQLLTATKIVQNFENPNINDKNFSMTEKFSIFGVLMF